MHRWLLQRAGGCIFQHRWWRKRMPTVRQGLFRWLFRGGARLEDFADRLNHVWTFGLLLVLGAVISWKHGYQSPITCWTPAHYEESPSQTDFVDQTCWASYYFFKELDKRDTTFGGYIEPLPFVTQEISEELKEQATITYYQWVPVILCLQALLFKLPYIFMYLLHGISGLDFDKVAGLTTGYHFLNLKERRSLANQIGRYIYRWCKGFPRGLPWGLLTAVWLIVKLLYCINVIIQMAYIDKFMRISDELENNSATFTSYGDAIYDNIAKNNGSLWKVAPMFPPQVMCDISSDMSRIKSDLVFKYPMQCDLNANPFSERVYMFLWVWLLFVAVETPLSCVVWVIRTLLPYHRQRYIKRFLEMADGDGEDTLVKVSKQELSQLTCIIGEDGVMVLKLVSANSSELLVRDVICAINRMARRETH